MLKNLTTKQYTLIEQFVSGGKDVWYLSETEFFEI